MSVREEAEAAFKQAFPDPPHSLDAKRFFCHGYVMGQLDMLREQQAKPEPTSTTQEKDPDRPCWACGVRPKEWFVAHGQAGSVSPPRPIRVCLGCGKPFASPDHDPRCSSCVESGTGPEPSLPPNPRPILVGSIWRWGSERFIVTAFDNGRVSFHALPNGLLFMYAERAFRAGMVWVSDPEGR